MIRYLENTALRIVVLVLLIIALVAAGRMVWQGEVFAAEPVATEQAVVEDAGARSYELFVQKLDERKIVMEGLFKDFRTATTREARAMAYGEALARTLDSIIDIASTQWHPCHQAYTNGYVEYLKWQALTQAAVYHKLTAIAGDPVSDETSAGLNLRINVSLMVAPALKQQVTCGGQDDGPTGSTAS
jgi:hypothetical protein